MSRNLVWGQLRLADFVLVALVLTAIGVSARHFATSKPNSQVYVYKENLLWGVYPLDRDEVIAIDEHNTIEIKGDRVHMIKADCPDKRCIKQGWATNLPIICLPNRVIVEVKASETEHKLILH